MPRSNRMVSSDPCTGALIWEGAAGDPRVAVEAARAALPAWTGLGLEARIALLQGYRDIVRDRAEDLAVLISRETGKPLWEARTEAASVSGKVDISIRAQAERAGLRMSEVEGVRQVTRHRPHGVLAVLGPFNFPAHLPNGHIVPALLAGNTVVFKPSEKAPAVATFMADCWRAAGLPDGVLNLVHGGAAAGKVLARAPGVDGLLFTGSVTAGQALHRQFADRPQILLALEMGGNNPLIVWDTDDTAAAASLILQSAYLSSGQRCTSARRLIVRNGGHVQLIEALTALIDRTLVGAPFDAPAPFMGPVIDNGAADGLELRQAELRSRGARALRPLGRLRPDRPFLTPALLDVTDAGGADDEEHFGPLLQLVRVDSFEAAIEQANATRFGLAAGLIGGCEVLYDRFRDQVRAGVVNWNRPTSGASSSAPFGGVGLSGNHRPSAYYAADYCAYPVASLEAPFLFAEIGQGLGAE